MWQAVSVNKQPLTLTHLSIQQLLNQMGYANRDVINNSLMHISYTQDSIICRLIDCTSDKVVVTFIDQLYGNQHTIQYTRTQNEES